jgi:hypothetical protein
VSAIEYREYTLLCDGDGGKCIAQFGPFGVEQSRAKLRAQAAKAGWTYVRSALGHTCDDDYCPAHKPAEPSP